MTTFAVSKLQKNAKRRGNNRKFRWQRRCKNRLFGQRHYHHRRHSEIRRIWGGASYDERRSNMYIGQNSLIFLVFHGAFGLIYSDVLHTFIKLSQEYWYIDNITPETFCKSLAVCFLSILSCFVICFLKDKFKEQK